MLAGEGHAMRIAITGASGFVGSSLATSAAAAGHTVLSLVRRAPRAAGEVAWQPESGAIDATALGAIDAVVHLAGDNVAAGRWTARRRTAIAASRGPVTTALCRTLAGLPQRPSVLVSASGTGIYGDRGDEVLTEDSEVGDGFLADVARAWEAGTAAAADAGVRVVNLRIGMVCDPAGGALRRMLPPFRLGLGGRLGSGRQWLGWITRDDLVAAILFCLQRDLHGPVLAVAPQPVTNRAFTAALGRALHRPTALPVPAFALRMLFGDMANELLLASQRTMPTRLPAAGFPYRHPDLEPAMRSLFAKTPGASEQA